MTPNTSASSEARSSAVARIETLIELGARFSVFAPASPGSEAKVKAGIAELRRLGFAADLPVAQRAEGYFAASGEARRVEFLRLLGDTKIDGLIGLRGGYGSNYLLDASLASGVGEPKAVMGFSDLTSLQIFLWQQFRWVTFYGPMVAAGVGGGGGGARGFGGEVSRSSHN